MLRATVSDKGSRGPPSLFRTAPEWDACGALNSLPGTLVAGILDRHRVTWLVLCVAIARDAGGHSTCGGSWNLSRN